MAIAKSSQMLLASQALAAGASVSIAELNLTTSPGARVFVKITNGASAPTTAPSVQFFSGEATGIKRDHHSQQASLTANAVTHIPARYTAPDMFANATITAGATNGCTVEAYAQVVTSL